MVCADMNGDGRADVVLQHNGAYNGYAKPVGLTVLLANGQGGFERGQTINVIGRGLHSMQAVDINADGHLDIVAAMSNHAAVLLGNGDGTLGPVTQWGADDAPWAFAVGDVNGDNKPDLLGGSFYAGHVTELLHR